MQERETRERSRHSVKIFELWYSVVINACVLETPESSKEPSGFRRAVGWGESECCRNHGQAGEGLVQGRVGRGGEEGQRSVCMCESLLDSSIEFHSGGWRRKRRSSNGYLQILVWVREGMMTVQQ